MKKNMYFIMLFICLVFLSANNCKAETYSGTCGANVTWSLENGRLTISGSGPMKDCKGVLNDSIPWYDHRSEIRYIVIDEGVTSIGDYSFDGCYYLVGITIPNTVTRIGNWAFGECVRLSSISIPNSVTSIEGCAFHSCSNLVSVNIPNKISTIETACFCVCQSLTEISIPDSVKVIKDSAFSKCSKLKKINLSGSLTTIEGYVFKECDSLENVYFNNVRSKWNNVTIGKENECLANAIIHCIDDPNEFILNENYKIKSNESNTISAIYRGLNLSVDSVSFECDDSISITISEIKGPYDRDEYKEWEIIAEVTGNYVGTYELTLKAEGVEPVSTQLVIEPSEDDQEESDGKDIFSVYPENNAIVDINHRSFQIGFSDYKIEATDNCTVRIHDYDTMRTVKVIQDITTDDYTLYFDFNIEDLMFPNKYYITLDSDTIILIDEKDSNKRKAFSGINDKSWVFYTPIDYPHIHNPTSKIDNSLYDVLFIPLKALLIKGWDDGTEGICYGWCYTTGAWENRYLELKKIIRGEAGNYKLCNLNENSKSELSDYSLLEYMQLAHLYQYTVKGALKKNEHENQYDEIINAIRIATNGESNNEIILGIHGNERHALYPLSISDDGMSVMVLDCNGDLEEKVPFIKELTFLEKNGEITGFTIPGYSDYTSITYCPIESDLDDLIHNNNRINLDDYLVHSSSDISNDNLLMLEGVHSNNTASTNNQYLYWTKEPVLKTDIAVDDEVGITDGYHEVSVTSKGNASALLNIQDHSVIITPSDSDVKYTMQYIKADDDGNTKELTLDVSTESETQIKENNSYLTIDGENITSASITYETPDTQLEKDVDSGKNAYIFKVLDNEIVELSVVNSGECGDNLTWKLISDGTLFIDGTGDMYDYVTEQSPWYGERSSILKVIIENGVTNMGENAFYGCDNIATITIPETMLSIKDSAFLNSSLLEKVSYEGSEAQWQDVAIGSGNNILNTAEIIYALRSIWVDEGIVNGRVSTDRKGAENGNPITLSVELDEGYALGKNSLFVTYIDENNDLQTIVPNRDENDLTKYSFYMPAYDVTIHMEPMEMSTWEYLNEQLSTDGASITLTQDLIAVEGNDFLTVPEDTTVTLNLNGHTIDGSALDSESILQIDGELFITNDETLGEGAIKGSDHNTVVMINSGNLTMTGGMISGTGCESTVYVSENGNFMMSDGTLSASDANDVVLVNGIFTMTGGMIKGDELDYGHVYVEGEFNISGAPVLSVYLKDSLINIIDPLEEGTEINVTSYTAPTVGFPVVITNGFAGNTDLTCFVTDNPDHAFSLTDFGEVQLATDKYSIIVGALSGGTITASPKKAAKNDLVTLVVEPYFNYAVDTVSYTYTNDLGDHTVDIPVNEGVYSFNMPSSDVTVNATFILTAPRFSSARLELSGKLIMRFYVAYPDNYTPIDDKVTFSIKGKETEVAYENSVEESDGRYFSCPINAYQMADPITAVYYHGENEVSSIEYTVMRNLDHLNKNTSGDIQALVQATMNYGHFIQPYLAVLHGWTLGKDMEHEVMDAWSDIAATSEMETGYPHTWNTCNSAYVKGARYFLTLNDTTTLNVKVVLREEATSEVTATAMGHSVTPVDIGNNTWQISLPGIPANALGIPYRFTLSIGEEEVFSIDISALSYVNLVLSSGNATHIEQKALASLYNYAIAAEACD